MPNRLRIFTVAMILALALVLMAGCSGDENTENNANETIASNEISDAGTDSNESTSYDGQYEDATTEEIAEETFELDEASIDYAGLSLGQTADFGDYSITLDSATIDGDSLIVDIHIESTDEEFEFASTYITLYDGNGQTCSPSFVEFVDSEGNKSADASPIITAGQSAVIEITYDYSDQAELLWDQDENIATWVFEASE